jgi:nicotinate-nucleotide pyrophosphorylase (carboxylating)
MVTEARRAALCSRLSWEAIDPEALRPLLVLARAEDLEGHGLRRRPERTGDPSTALLPPGARGRATLVARHPLVACGLPLVPLVAEVYGGGFLLREPVADGTPLDAGQSLGWLEGNVGAILTAERVLLNFLQRLSGVATETARHVAALGPTSTRLLDTRKTTPGFRLLEKYAVACGGGWNHRLGLYDRFMLKDNHLAVSGLSGESLADLVRRARAEAVGLPVEVEVDRLEQIPPVLDAGADVIMLDNFDDDALREALALIGARAATEASGGITLARLPRLASLELDFISTGATVHQARWVDIGLDWEL